MFDAVNSSQKACTLMKRKRNVDPILLDSPSKRGKVDKSWSAHIQDTPRYPTCFKEKSSRSIVRTPSITRNNAPKKLVFTPQNIIKKHLTRGNQSQSTTSSDSIGTCSTSDISYTNVKSSNKHQSLLSQKIKKNIPKSSPFIVTSQNLLHELQSSAARNAPNKFAPRALPDTAFSKQSDMFRAGFESCNASNQTLQSNQMASKRSNTPRFSSTMYTDCKNYILEKQYLKSSPLDVLKVCKNALNQSLRESSTSFDCNMIQSNHSMNHSSHSMINSHHSVNQSSHIMIQSNTNMNYSSHVTSQSNHGMVHASSSKSSGIFRAGYESCNASNQTLQSSQITSNLTNASRFSSNMNTGYKNYILEKQYLKSSPLDVLKLCKNALNQSLRESSASIDCNMIQSNRSINHSSQNMTQSSCSMNHSSQNMTQSRCSMNHSSQNMTQSSCSMNHSSQNMIQSSCSMKHSSHNMIQSNDSLNQCNHDIIQSNHGINQSNHSINQSNPSINQSNNGNRKYAAKVPPGIMEQFVQALNKDRNVTIDMSYNISLNEDE